ncbi:MAG TPA: amino acid deaminase/aldolase [Bacillales bacterium]|nr:amino acid deaminase/aldolase [Bacillales bacterium]
MERDYSYYKKVFDGISKPFAYVDLDLFDENICNISSGQNGKNIRVASKSIRSVALLERILKADSCFRGIMCFSPFEAVYLAKQGFEDLLIGYPVWDPSALGGIAKLNRAGKSITLMIDSIPHIEQIEKAARDFGVRMPVCLDIDMSLNVPGLHFGVWRSPIRTVGDAGPVVEKISASEHVYLDGVMGYEAQIAGVGDRYPGQAGKNAVVRTLKRRSIKKIAEKRAALVTMIQDAGISLRFVNGGGTGSLHTTGQEDVVTEVTVGSGFYSPGLFDNYRDFRYQPAAGYAIEMVRKPKADIYTCFGGGYAASGAAGKDRLPKPYLPEGAELVPLEGAGEVQTPISYRGREKLDFGDPILMRHAKAGELCERFNHLYCVSNGEIVDKVTTYRGDGQCFL